MAIRNGRVKTSSGSSGVKVIDGKSGPFRFFNAGSGPFTIKPKSGASSNVTLEAECSVDVKVTNECTLTAASIDAIYDFIGEGSRNVRSGRFKGDGAPTTIVQDADNEDIYRIYNSGTVSIVIDPSGHTLPPRYSIDISTTGDITVQGTGIECIYEKLDSVHEVRSGRFNLVTPSTSPVKIIDLSTGGNNGWYRLFNTGGETIQLHRGAGSGTIQIGSAAPDQSFDFQVGAGNKDIYVLSDDTTKVIKGIYDYLGTP